MTKIRDADFLKLFAESNDPVLTTGELAEALEVEPQTVNNRLNPLVDQGILETKQAGSSKIWWHNNIAKHLQEVSIVVDRHKIGVEVIDSLDIPGDEQYLEQRRNAVNTIFQYIYDSHPLASSAGLKNEAKSIAPGTGYNENSIWHSCIRPCLKQTTLIDHPAPEKKQEWKIADVVSELKNEHGDYTLWQNWKSRKTEWREAILSNIWESINQHFKSYDWGVNGLLYNDDTCRIKFDHTQHELYCSYTFNEPIWLSYAGELTVGLEYKSVQPSSQESDLNQQFGFDTNVEEIDFTDTQFPVKQFPPEGESTPVFHRITTQLAVEPLESKVSYNQPSVILEEETLDKIHRRVKELDMQVNSHLD